MKVFLTGASGALGVTLIPQLIEAGHQVIALSRSQKADDKINAAGRTEIVRGSIADLSVLKDAAGRADAVIHAAFNHDVFGDPEGYANALAEDRAAITTVGEALVSSGTSGSPKTLIYTSGTLGNVGADEASGSLKLEHLPRYLSEDLTLGFAKHGVRSFVAKLAPVVHDAHNEHVFITGQIAAAKKAGYVAYVGEGKNVWCSAHYVDVAALLVLLLSKGESGYYHAVDEEGIPVVDIAEYLGKKLNMPTKSVTAEQALQEMGLIGMLLTLGQRTTATYTKQVTGWQPKQIGLLQELEGYKY